MNEFLWGVYPYLCAASFFVVPFIRMVYRPFGWSTRASGMFGRSVLGGASLALHWGLVLVFAGHVAGLVGGLLGLGGWIAFFYWTGLVGGLLALAGSATALVRRFVNPEVRAMSQPDDYIVHVFLLLILGIALYQVIAHQIFGIAYTASAWFASLWALSPQPELMASASLLTKLHVFLALTFFAYFPFTKLVHAWTYPINYAVRPLQSMRTRAQQFKRQWETAMRSDQSWMVAGVGLLVVGFVAAGVTFASNPLARPDSDGANSSADTSTDVQTGYPLYVSQCARCHGLDGRGDGPGAGSRVFANPPRDFTQWPVLDNPKAAKAVITNAVKNGFGASPLRNKAMPGFPKLSDRQVDSLLPVLKRFRQSAKDAE
ncbi:MAG: respiratory nitrate reductase subunit gamma [Bradymonadaceae bacterium]